MWNARLQEVAELYCECKTDNYFCLKHSMNHIKQIGKFHNVSPLFITVEGELKEKAIKGITSRCASIPKAKLDMKNKCREIIEFTMEAFRRSTKKLNEDQKYFNSIRKMIIEKSEVDKEAYESGFILSDSVIGLTDNLEIIRKEINSCFYCESHSTVADDEELFWLQDTELHKINLTAVKKSLHTIQFSFINHNNSCKISKDTYFVHNCNSTSCYLIEIKTNTITPLPNMPVPGSTTAVGFILDTVYIICGYNQICKYSNQGLV